MTTIGTARGRRAGGRPSSRVQGRDDRARDGVAPIPTASAREESGRQTCDEHSAHRRDRDEPGDRRGRLVRHLDVGRQIRGHREEPDSDDGAQRDAGGDGAVPENLDGQEGRRRAAFDDDEDRERHRREPEQGERPSADPGLDRSGHREDERDERDREGHGPRDVEPAAGRSPLDDRDGEQGEHEGPEAERDVDPEHPLPPEVVADEPAEHGPTTIAIGKAPPRMLRICGRSRGVVTSATIVCPMSWSPAELTPCTTRASASTSMLGANPHAADDTMKSVSDAR